MKKVVVLSTIILGVASMVVTGCATTGKGLSDEEQIQAQMQEGIDAIMAKDYDAFGKYVSESFYSSVIGDRDDLLAYLKNADEMGFLDELEVDLSETVITVEGDKGTIDSIMASGSFGYQGLSFDGVKENGVWMITGLSPY